MKTINCQLAKKLYDAGVVIESEFEIGESGKLFKRTGIKYDWAYPAPNCEEIIEFLKRDILIEYSEIFDQYIIRHKKVSVFRDTLLEALEATLEYLLTNGYIGQNTKN